MYGGAIAELYHLPDMWRFQPYAGVELRYVYARTNASSPITGRMANDRFDVGGLVGVEVRMARWLGIFGEAGLGYASGYETNSIAGFRQRTSGFGLLTRAGLGLQVHFGRATK